MLGDDLNATVMTERFGFGKGFGRAQGVGGCAEMWEFRREGKTKTMGSDERPRGQGGFVDSEKERREGSNCFERRSTRTSGLTTGQRRQREKQ